MRKREVRTLWGQEFDIVKGGLAEHQVIAFVEDLLKRYNALVEERKHWDSLKILAEAKVRQAEKVAATILQEAMEKVAGENRRFSEGSSVESDYEFRPEREQQDTLWPATSSLDGTRGEPGEMRMDLSSEAPRATDRSNIREATVVPAEGSSPDPSLCELAVQARPPKGTTEAADVTSFLAHLEQSAEASIRDYSWSPSSGWVVTVSLRTTKSLASFLTEIPGVERVGEEQLASEAGSPSSLPVREGTLPPEAPSGPPRRVRVWLVGR